MNQSMVLLARRAACELHSQTSSWRFFCSSSFPASNNKLFVGGSFFSLLIHIYTSMQLRVRGCGCGFVYIDSELSVYVYQASCFLIGLSLFVEGLSWSVDEKTLKNAFSSYGEVKEVRIMYDKDTGRSRGFGFVNFSKDDEAKLAKDAMDGKAFLGRPLRISFALDRVRGTSVVVPRFSNAQET